MNRLAVLTIGQSPRVDVMPDIKNILGNEIDVVEYGILDKFEEKEAADLLYPTKEDNMLVSRLNSGKQIKMSESKVYVLVQDYIEYIEKQDIDKILLLCTGKFPNFKFNGMLIKPFDIVHSITKILAGTKKIGLIVPDKKQLNSLTKLWKKSGVEVIAKSASPYELSENKLAEVAKQFQNEDIPFIVMDCMGYSSHMKKIVKENSNKPVILSRTLVARLIKELF